MSIFCIRRAAAAADYKNCEVSSFGSNIEGEKGRLFFMVQVRDRLFYLIVYAGAAKSMESLTICIYKKHWFISISI